MKNSVRLTLVSVLLLAAYILSACTGVAPQAQSQSSSPSKGSKVQAEVIAFTGTVDAINGSQWTINGQVVTVDPQRVDPNIKVGDVVKVEGTVNSDGSVAATTVETNGPDDTSSATPDPASSATPDPVSSLTPEASQTPDPSQTSTEVAHDPNEVFGTVEAITADTITIDGVTYQIANFSEIKDTLAVGDTVKIHFITNADGSLTVREAEKSASADQSVDDNSNSNGGSDDGSSHDANDDHGNDNSSQNSNDDDGGSSGGNGGSGNGNGGSGDG